MVVTYFGDETRLSRLLINPPPRLRLLSGYVAEANRLAAQRHSAQG